MYLARGTRLKITVATSKAGGVLSEKLLLDTGPLVAFFDRRDKWHAKAVEFFAEHQTFQFLTTWPVITEACHFVNADAAAKLVGLVGSRVIRVADMDEHSALRVADLMKRYRSMSPDLADISLVWLAEETGVHAIATIDVADFSVLRINGRARFRLVGFN